MLTHQTHPHLLVAPLFSLFSSAFIRTLSSKSSGCVLHFTTHNNNNNNTYLQESREIKLHPLPPSSSSSSSSSSFGSLTRYIYIYKTDRQRKCSLFLLHRRRRARVFSIVSTRAANEEEEKSRDFREDASVMTAKTFASSRRHPRR
jgi:hypothetical protein